jgi:GNAT superfamily N-acetyltransferase
MQIRQADPIDDLALVRMLWGEYLTWVNGELVARYGVSFPVEEILASNLAELDRFMPPGGRLILGDDVGIGCLQRIGPSIGEIKRMYVRPAARGTGVGRAVLTALIDAAVEAGFQRVRLDSARFLTAAHGLYRSAGFVAIDPYAESEIPPQLWPRWVFMERTLEAGATAASTETQAPTAR